MSSGFVRGSQDAFGDWNGGWLLLFLVVSLPLLFNLSIERFFSADGSFYFAQLLDNRDFADFSPTRVHAVYLSQWPVVVATRLGVTDMALLKFCFGFGLYLPAFVSFLICLAVADESSRSLLIFPLLSQISISNIGEALLFAEYHVLVYLTWPIFFLLVRKEPLDLRLSILLGLLLFAYTRCYESAVATGAIFLAMIMARLKFQRSATERGVMVVALLLVLAAMTIALQSILDPRDSDNRASFIRGLENGLSNPLFLCALPFIAAFLSGTYLKLRSLIILGLCIGILGYAFHAFFGTPVRTGQSFVTRTLTLTYLPVLLVAAWGCSRYMPELSRFHRTALLVFASVATLAQLNSSRTWLDYRAQFRVALSTNSGFVRIEDTAIHNHSQGWSWTSPILSYLWSRGDVKTIILNPEGSQWQPFDPRSQRILTQNVPSASVLED